MRKLLSILSLCCCLLAGKGAMAQLMVSDSITATGVVLMGSYTGAATSATLLTLPDDIFSTPVPIGFSFNFYGNNYTQCLISPNGNITFNLASAGGYAAYTITAPLAGNSTVFNNICSPWCDLLIPSGGSIYYYTSGTAPNRKFTIVYCGIAMFSCTSLYQTSSIVLYETSNYIDLLVGHHTTCMAWNGGYAIEGIQNATGTASTVVPGRDFPNHWNADNDAYRFSPIGGGTSYTVNAIPYSFTPPTAGITMNWYDSTTGAFVGSGSTVTVHPTVATTYMCVAEGCKDPLTTSYISDIISSCTGTPVAGAVVSTTPTACATTTVTLTDTGNTPGSALSWQSSPDGTTWTNIAGAYGATYTFTGLTTSMYYRCVATCPAGAASSTTASIAITYTTACPCVLAYAGTVYANVAYACPTATITLTNTTYSVSAATMQWQASADSVTWTDIAGAVSNTYSLTGMSATTYYRLKFDCTSGSTIHSAGVKILYTPVCVCSGAPTAGIATASPGYCSSCLLTLNLTGYTLADSISFRWQQSADNVTWYNLGGAGTTFSLTPHGSYYYRCNVTCNTTASETPSNSVFVPYHYSFIADSVNVPAPCSDPTFYLSMTGYSPSLYVKIYYGDGLSDSVAAIDSVTWSRVIAPHPYIFAGAYSVKEVLYDNNTAIDSILFTYNYPYCSLIPINLYFDLDGDCAQSLGEPDNGYPMLIQVDSAGIIIDTISVTSGMYYPAYGPPGTIYAFHALTSISAVATCPAGGVIYDTVSATAPYYVQQYFGLTCTSSVFDLAVYNISMGAGPNRLRGNIYAYNNTCLATPATVSLDYSIRYNDHMNSNVPPTTWVPGHATWNLASSLLGTGVPYHIFYDAWENPIMVTIGDTVSASVHITPTAGDADLTNNSCVVIDTVKAACDPNAITADPGSCMSPDSTELIYTIHFENTGNDTATNIHVMDTLDNNLDVSSMRIMMASATMHIDRFNDGIHNVVKFDFPNIHLPDSSHHGLCDGAVMYKIKRYADVPVGTDIINYAGIYFDINDAVMTNVAVTTVGCPDITGVAATEHNNKVDIYPNPATDVLTIKTSSSTYTSVSVTNTLGQVVVHQAVTGTQTKIDIKQLPAGVYSIALRGADGLVTRKFVKL